MMHFWHVSVFDIVEVAGVHFHVEHDFRGLTIENQEVLKFSDNVRLNEGNGWVSQLQTANNTVKQYNFNHTCTKRDMTLSNFSFTILNFNVNASISFWVLYVSGMTMKQVISQFPLAGEECTSSLWLFGLWLTPVVGLLLKPLKAFPRAGVVLEEEISLPMQAVVGWYN